MSEKILVPVLGESISEATVSQWLKKEGETVEADEPIVELETDKVNLEVPAPVSGVLTEINSKDGSVVEVGAILGSVSENKESSNKPEEIKKIESLVEENTSDIGNWCENATEFNAEAILIEYGSEGYGSEDKDDKSCGDAAKLTFEKMKKYFDKPEVKTFRELLADPDVGNSTLQSVLCRDDKYSYCNNNQDGAQLNKFVNKNSI